MSYDCIMDQEQATDEAAGLFDYSEEPWYGIEISLTLTHADLDPDRITDMLGMKPSGYATPGSALGTSDGIWSIDFRGNSDQGDELIAALAKIEEHVPTISQLMSFGVKAYISIFGIVRDGSTLAISSQSLEKIAAIAIPVVLIPNANDR